MKDKYDEQIDELMALDAREFKVELKRQWSLSRGLFQFLSANGEGDGEGDWLCGCPTMVKQRDSYHSEDNKLDEAVLQSPLIPETWEDIPQSREVLEEFARIQRMADKVYGRKA